MKLYYEDQWVKIYLGDCREILPQLSTPTCPDCSSTAINFNPLDESDYICLECGKWFNKFKIDLVLTDPPYNPGILKDVYHRRTKQPQTSMSPKRIYPDSWDEFDATEIILELARYPMIIWGGNNFPLPISLCWFVWDKFNGSNDFSDCELAWTNLPKQGIRIFRWLWSGAITQQPEPRLHPTMKPLALMKWCISKVPEANIVLDPFAGSGTTLRAAKDLNRKSIGIEIEEKYCEIAAKRCSQQVFDLSIK